MSKALSWAVQGSYGDKGRLQASSILLGHPHHGGHHGNVGWGLPRPVDATSGAALHVPSLPACDKQDFNPERDSSVVTTLRVVIVLGGMQVGASLHAWPWGGRTPTHHKGHGDTVPGCAGWVVTLWLGL